MTTKLELELPLVSDSQQTLQHSPTPASYGVMFYEYARDQRQLTFDCIASTRCLCYHIMNNRELSWYQLCRHLWRRVTARFVTRFNLWLRHDLWPHNASICDPARFVTKSASICDQRYTMILESNLCRGKLVFVFTLIMYAKWYNMMIIYIYMNYDIILI